MAISTYTRVVSYNPYLICAVEDVAADTTADQTFHVNTNGRRWYLTDSASGNNAHIINTVGTSLSTMTGFQVWTGTSKSGTQITNSANLSSTTYASASLVASSPGVPLTATTLYGSCTSTTATAGARFNFYLYADTF